MLTCFVFVAPLSLAEIRCALCSSRCWRLEDPTQMREDCVWSQKNDIIRGGDKAEMSFVRQIVRVPASIQRFLIRLGVQGFSQ